MPTEIMWLILPWTLGFVFLGRIRRCPPLGAEGEATKVSVIIPARNEVKRLPPLLASLRAQDYPWFEVIVVDDNSTDGTAELARHSGATVISLTELEPGWLGKPHACWKGAEQATGDLFIFLDADTELKPSGLRRLVSAYREHGGLVSVQPYHRMEKTYERLSSLFFIIMMASIRSFTLAGERVKSNGSFGPCILCSREDYFRTGGHQLVRQAIIDDVALAREMSARGVGVHNFVGQGVISFRMYPGGVSELTEGWTKNFAVGAMTTDFLMLLMIGAWVSSSCATVDALRGGLEDGLTRWAVAGIISYTAYVGQIWWLLRKLGNFGVGSALAYPISMVYFCYVLGLSFYRTLVRNSVSWKGRMIPVRPSSESSH